MLDLFHPSQLEQKFGGEAKNSTVCWPPILPEGEIGYDPKNLLSEQEYEETVRHNDRLKRDPEVQAKFDREAEEIKEQEEKDNVLRRSFSAHLVLDEPSPEFTSPSRYRPKEQVTLPSITDLSMEDSSEGFRIQIKEMKKGSPRALRHENKKVKEAKRFGCCGSFF